MTSRRRRLARRARLDRGQRCLRIGLENRQAAGLEPLSELMGRRVVPQVAIAGRVLPRLQPQDVDLEAICREVRGLPPALLLDLPALLGILRRSPQLR